MTYYVVLPFPPTCMKHLSLHTKNVLSVVIDASDNLAGVISFITASLTLSEDGPSSGELEVVRTSSLIGMITVNWVALYTDGQNHSVSVADILVSTRGTITFEDNSATPTANILLQLRPNTVSNSTIE